MAKNMDEFLLEFYKRQHFRSMPIEQFVTFCGYVKKKDYNGNMKEWVEDFDLLKRNAAGELETNAGLYVRKDLPDPTEVGGEWELTDEEWAKLYKAFRNTFREMDANRKAFKYEKKAIEFLDKYFGDQTKLFSNATASPMAESAIGQLKNLLDSHPELEFALINRGALNDDYSFADLKSDIQDKKYNTNQKAQDRLVRVVTALRNEASYGNDENKRLLAGFDFESIEKGFEDEALLNSKIATFKSFDYKELLKTLYKNSKIYDVFKNYDKGKISGKLEEAKDRIKYNDDKSDDYVKPKKEDDLTLPERISEWWDETYENYLEKYEQMKGDHMFFSDNAKVIVSAISKNKIKPTDGLDKVLGESEKIIEKIGDKFTAKKHFKWMVDTINKLKKTMPKTVEGALQSGHKMKHLVSKLIVEAVQQGKEEEAKTAMEVLTVIKYGYTTSKIMDTMNKTDLTLFSDSKYSWNKNAGVQLITNAMDKTLNWAFRAVGYGLTIAGNAYRLRGAKFNDKRNKFLKAAQETWQRDTDAARVQATNELHDFETGKTTAETTKAGITASHGIDDANIGAKQTDLSTHLADLATKKDELDTLKREKQELEFELNGITQNYQFFDDWLNDPANATSPDRPAYENERNTLLAQKSRIEGRIYNIEDAINGTGHKQADYDALKTLTDDERTNINDFLNATRDIEFYNAKITEQNDLLANFDDKHQDMYARLMRYWDTLQNSETNWFGSKERAQEDFNTRRAAIIAMHAPGHGFAYAA